jgi:hypothetical protein
MPLLQIGGVEVKVMEWRRMEDEHGDGDWTFGNWSTRLLLEDATEVNALRSAISAATPRAYRRSVNGDLMGGPITAASGDLLGGGANFGIEIGEQETVVTRWVPPEYHYTLALTLREA